MDQEHALALMRPELLRYAMLRLRNRDQAEDAVQEALLAALQDIGSFSGASSLRTWVGGILKHKIADCLRASSREEQLQVDDREVPSSDPHERLAGERFVQTVDRSLARLPGLAAKVFVMREVIGMDTAEVCERLSISATNCWVMVHRARLRLRLLVPNEF